LKSISALIALSVVSLAGAQGEPKTVVTVNGQAISSTEYYHRMEHLSGVYAAYGERFVEVIPGIVTLDRLITERVTIQLAESHSVAPTPAEIDQAYEARKAANPMLEANATAEGLTAADLRYQVQLDLCRFKLLTEGILVTDQEVQDNYKNHPERYVNPKRVDLRIIVVDSDADKAAVDADLAAGKEFGAVATARSLDLSKLQGGLLKGVPFDSLDASIRDALNAAKIGNSTGWLKVPGQPANSTLIERIRYESAVEAKPIPYDAKLGESIRRQMMMERGSAKNNVGKMVGEMLAKAKVEIADKTFEKAWLDLRSKATSGGTKPAG